MFASSMKKNKTTYQSNRIVAMTATKSGTVFSHVEGIQNKTAFQEETSDHVKKNETTLSTSDTSLNEILDGNKDGGVSIVALANFGIREFSLNWIKSLEKNQFTKFVIICTDRRVYAYLAEKAM